MITNAYPDFADSYRGIFIRRLCRDLADQGLEVVVLTPRVYAASPLIEEDAGIRVYRFRYPSSERPLNQVEGVPVLPMAVFMASGLHMALRLVAREAPDIIHGNWIVPTGLIAALAGLLTRTPVINTARGMDVRISRTFPMRLLFSLAVRLSQALTVVSPAMRACRGLEEATVIPSGVAEGFFTQPSERSEALILSSRSLEPVYDIETLVRSVPLVLEQRPEARFIIAGSGSQECFLKDLARELAIAQRITFLGRVPPEKIAAIMTKARVFVSTAVEDGTSVALLEALAAGLVPVVTDIAANRPWVEHDRSGLLFAPRHAGELAGCIVQALSLAAGTERTEGERARLHAEISSRESSHKYMHIYNVLSKRSSP